MSEFETVPRFDPSLSYREGLAKMLEEPIHLTSADIDIESTRPTPLDPDHVYVRNLDRPIGEWYTPTPEEPYVDFVGRAAVAQVLFYADLIGIGEGAMRKLLELETKTQINVRAEHNMHALKRLIPALLERPADDVMIEIIQKARSGGADLPEMVRLIKEYPEMGSIETSSFHATAGGDEGYDPVRAAYAFAGTLISTFRDAEVRLGSNGIPPKVKDSTLLPGVKTRTEVIATIASHDSYTEMVMKYSFIELKGIQKLLGLTTYLRTRDHDRSEDIMESTRHELLHDIDSLPAERARELLGKIAAGIPIDELL